MYEKSKSDIELSCEMTQEHLDEVDARLEELDKEMEELGEDIELLRGIQKFEHGKLADEYLITKHQSEVRRHRLDQLSDQRNQILEKLSSAKKSQEEERTKLQDCLEHKNIAVQELQAAEEHFEAVSNELAPLSERIATFVGKIKGSMTLIEEAREAKKSISQVLAPLDQQIAAEENEVRRV